MDNRVYPTRGTQAATGQQGEVIAFLNKIEQAQIAQGIDYES
jgi:hypothetical protein